MTSEEVAGGAGAVGAADADVDHNTHMVLAEAEAGAWHEDAEAAVHTCP